MRDRDRTFSGVGGTLTLRADGTLFGAGWDLALFYTGRTMIPPPWPRRP